ncbi:hypothetical protein [Streptomyces sp. BA2]|uniref:hypothetical protein n=1 Tax=Streptomyces sp. BA2 TaxID=436595 RepID=UPI00132A15C0|nr:hypothetical protein [Streptomyces sp. BA2]MWA07947.1 hypothetical protein [Streptomyces sp. BA2]
MTISIDWVRDHFTSGGFTLTGPLLGLGSPTDILFSDDLLGSSWSVEIEQSDPDALVGWGTALVKGVKRKVEVHFLGTSQGEPNITGIAIYVDLNEDWESSIFPDLNVGALKPFGFQHPEAALIVDPDHPYEYPYIEGAAQYGQPDGRLPRRFCVEDSGAGYLDIYSRLGVQQRHTDFNSLLSSLPFAGKLPSSVNVPSEMQSIIGGSPLYLSSVQVTLDQDSESIVGASISVEIGELDHDVEVIPELFTARALTISLELMGSEFLIGAEYTGTIGGTEATVSGAYASGGQIRLLGSVKDVSLDGSIHEWLNNAVGADVGQILLGSTVETMFVETNVPPSGTAALTAGFVVEIQVPGGHGNAYLSLTAIKQESVTVRGALEIPIPTAKYPGQRIVFQGSVVRANDGLTFSLAWDGDKTFEASVADLFHLLGVDENADVPFGDISLTSLGAVYRPSQKLLVLGANLPPLQIVVVNMGVT